MNEAESYLQKKMSGNENANSMTKSHDIAASASKADSDIKKKGLAIASLVCGIIGGWASTASIPAIICGHLALSKINKKPDIYAGKGLAVAGLVLGYLGLVLAVVVGVMRGTINALGY